MKTRLITLTAMMLTLASVLAPLAEAGARTP